MMTQAESDHHCDVCIVGAGLAGSLAAVGLRRQGLNVALVDTRKAPPPEFRAEKMGQDEMAAFTRLGLDAAIRQVITNIDEIWVARYARRPIRVARQEYGFAYHKLVGAVREGGAGAPMLGKVVAIETSADRQFVRLRDGRGVAARLVVIATGLGEAARRLAGVEARVVSPGHSLSLGFDLARPAEDYRFGSLVAYSERRGDRSAYLTLFPIGSAMRGNLFVYRRIEEDWTRSFRVDPTAGLAALVPALCTWTGPLAVSGPVAVRPLDLTEATGIRRPGLVLIGDAFMTCCPVPGVGIPKIITDVERLLQHAAQWFATPGMDEGKIANFYDDRFKRERDERSMAASLYARKMAVSEGSAWVARRVRNAVVRHGAISVCQAAAALGAVRRGAAA